MDLTCNYTRASENLLYLYKSCLFNPLHAKFFRGNKNIYLYFMSFFHIDMTQVVEILPQVR